MKPWLHALLLALLAIAAAILSLEEPQFGDDFTYWTFAYDFHQRGLDSLQNSGFHQLRWPIWAMVGVAQGLFGFGLLSYYFQPFLILVLGALTSFFLGWRLFGKPIFAWACGILFIFHPLVDANLTRPYPDIGEGLLGAFAILAWWGLMNAESRGRIVLYSVLCGLSLFLAEENRFTGLFFIPLLVCLTLFFFHRKWLRLFLPFAIFGLLLAGQMAFYHWKFDRWDYFVFANTRAKGKPGTGAVESVELWAIPFRFLDSLHKGGDLMPFYAVFAVFGIWFAWKRYGKLGRVVVAWFVLLYLAYACAPQQLWPFRPMLREADRFLSSLAIPYSILTVFGLVGVLGWLAQFARTRKFPEAVRRRPALSAVIATVVLAIAAHRPIGNRHFFSLGYVPEMRAYMRALPPDAVVFTHRQAKVLAHLVDDATARRIQWLASDKWITEPQPELIETASKANQFWYVRKLALMRLAKGIITEDENKKIRAQPPLAPWFDAPEKDWQLAAVLARSDTPDVVLYRRRMPATPPPLILTAQSPEFKDLLPALPFEWKKTKDGRDYHDEALELDWSLPPSLRGKLVRIEMQASSQHRDAFAVGVAFVSGKKVDPPYLLKPYFFPDGGKEFVCLAIPANADHCKLRIRFAKDVKWFKVTDFRVIVD